MNGIRAGNRMPPGEAGAPGSDGARLKGGSEPDAVGATAFQGAGTEVGNDPSDAELGNLAAAAIEQSAAGQGGQVKATVRGGWVLLQGKVAALFQKRIAEDAVRTVGGIRGVSNHIALESEGLIRRVSQSIDRCFLRDAKVSARRVQVTAYDHVITLSGFVRSEFERDEAEAAAWRVPGVAEVVNRIRINP